MGRACTVCEHPDRSDIEQRLVAGDTLATISTRTGLNRMALSRHRRDHSPAWLARVMASEPPREGTVRERIERIIADLQEVMADAKAGRRHTVILQAARELRGALETVGRITGELDERPTTVVNVTASEEWIELQTAILAALSPYPDARSAVARALAPLGAA